MNAMFAYIDAGTGSLLLQGVVAGLFTVILFFRQIKFRLRSLLHGKNNKMQRSQNASKDKLTVRIRL